jgi:hypothetical protein
MRKSIVGDPIFWPGLIYSPLNTAGLIFALGSISNSAGLIFEEFSESDDTAVCRRKTDRGWERIKVAFAVRSSDYVEAEEDIDLLVCWVDDSSDENGPSKLELSGFHIAANSNTGKSGGSAAMPGKLPPEGLERNFSEENEARSDFEETVRQLDERIKKLKST